MTPSKLKDSFLKACVPGEYSDGGGLFFLRQSPTSASWIFRFQLRRHRHRMGLGPYPAISLARARELATKWRSVAAEGRDPRQERAEERRLLDHNKPTLAEVTAAAFEAKKATLKDGGKAGQWIDPLRLHVLPMIEKTSPAALTVNQIVNTFRPIWQTKIETSKKAINRLDYIIRFAAASDADVDLGLIERAKMQLGPQCRAVKHLRALDWKDAPRLYGALGSSVAHLGFRFYILTVPRVAMVTKAGWAEIDGDIWTIPRARMKTDWAFRVPLTWQAKAVLAEAKTNNESAMIFHSPTAWKKGVISENTWNSWMKTNGFDTTAHGLRSTFRDWAAETEACSRDVAEMSLAHNIKGATEAAYFRSDLLAQRAAVLKKWSEYVTGLSIEDRAEVWEAKTAAAYERARRDGRIPADVTLMEYLERAG